MAKIFSFNKDAPALKAPEAPFDPDFHISLQVVHFDMGKGRDIQRFCVSADGQTKLYQRYFDTRNEFLHWLQPAKNIGTKAANEALDRAVAAPKEKVDLPFIWEEEGLIEDGFKLVAGGE
jgi:hypothetical protein